MLVDNIDAYAAGSKLCQETLACSVWNVPFFPVMPWQMTLVDLLMNTAGSAWLLRDRACCCSSAARPEALCRVGLRADSRWRLRDGA